MRSAIVASIGLALAGCRGAGETTDGLVPRGFRHNAWGPVGNAARDRGEIPSVPLNPQLAAWDAWGRANLREGDIVLRMGDARAAMGLFPFSKVSAAIAGSRFSHSGIVAQENGAFVVYDTTTTGPQRQPFYIWMMDVRGDFAVKRPKPEHAAAIPSAVAFCREAYLKQTPFDFNMKEGDSNLYCIELTQRAYETSGLRLSNPLKLRELPRYQEFPKIVALLKMTTKMVPDQKAYIIGNDNVGILSSPALETVYDSGRSDPAGLGKPATPLIAGRPDDGSSLRR